MLQQYLNTKQQLIFGMNMHHLLAMKHVSE